MKRRVFGKNEDALKRDGIGATVATPEEIL
jgi:hypothetical protein